MSIRPALIAFAMLGPAGLCAQTVTLIPTQTELTEAAVRSSQLVVRLDRPARVPVTVHFSVRGTMIASTQDAAVPGIDMQSVVPPVTIQPGETQALTTVSVFDDDEDELDLEYFNLDIASVHAPGGNTSLQIGTPTVRYRVRDNDHSFAVSASGGVEGGTAAVTVTVQNPSSEIMTVFARPSGGTAMPGADYDDSGLAVPFSPDQTAVTMAIPLLTDDAVEGPETVQLAVDVQGGSGTVAVDGSSVGFVIVDASPEGLCGIPPEDWAERISPILVGDWIIENGPGTGSIGGLTQPLAPEPSSPAVIDADSRDLTMSAPDYTITLAADFAASDDWGAVPDSVAAAAAEVDCAGAALPRLTFTGSVPVRDTTLDMTMRFYLLSEDLMMGTGLWQMSSQGVAMEGRRLMTMRRQ